MVQVKTDLQTLLGSVYIIEIEIDRDGVLLVVGVLHVHVVLTGLLVYVYLDISLD